MCAVAADGSTCPDDFKLSGRSCRRHVLHIGVCRCRCRDAPDGARISRSLSAAGLPSTPRPAPLARPPPPSTKGSKPAMSSGSTTGAGVGQTDPEPPADRKTRLLPRMRVLRAVADAVGKAPAGGMLPKLCKGAPPDAWAQVGCVCRGRRFWREFYRRFRTTLPDRIGIRRLTRRRSRRRPRPSRSSRRSRTPMPQQMYPNAEAA